MSPTRQEAASFRRAGAGTLSELQQSVMARMTVIAAAFWGLEVKNVQGAPRVIDTQLPPKTDAQDKRFPFIVVRPRAGTDTPQQADENSNAVFEIVLGTYSDTDAGADDIRSLIDAIRLSLAAEPAIADTAFEHTGPLHWDLPVEQPRPLWLGLVTTTWTLPRPRRITPEIP